MWGIFFYFLYIDKDSQVLFMSYLSSTSKASKLQKLVSSLISYSSTRDRSFSHCIGTPIFSCLGLILSDDENTWGGKGSLMADWLIGRRGTIVLRRGGVRSLRLVSARKAAASENPAPHVESLKGRHDCESEGVVRVQSCCDACLSP